MTVAKSISFSLPSADAMISAARGLFKKSDQAIALPARATKPTITAGLDPSTMDQSRYAHLLEHELDRQHLTAVEREDMVMLNRVRDALYGD